MNNITEVLMPSVPLLLEMLKKKKPKSSLDDSQKFQKSLKATGSSIVGILKKSKDASDTKKSVSGLQSPQQAVNFRETVIEITDGNSEIEGRENIPSPTSHVPSPIGVASSPPETAEVVVDFAELLKYELTLPVYDLGTDYMEMIIQYGYITMFVVVFPLGPMLALLNNFFEKKIDLYKLSVSRRSLFSDRSSIGAWESVLEVINIISVITNCYLLCMMSTQFDSLVPDRYQEYTATKSGRFIAMVIIEHVIMAMKTALSFLVPDVPAAVQENRAVIRIQQKEKTHSLLLQQLVNMRVYDDNKSVESRMKLLSGVLGSTSEEDVERQNAINKLSGRLGNGFFYNPTSLISLCCIPPLLQHLQFSPIYYLPCAFLMLSYLSSERTKHFKHQALGIVSDVQVFNSLVMLLYVPT